MRKVSSKTLELHNAPMVHIADLVARGLKTSEPVVALEPLGVPVVGWQSDDFPAFDAVSSGCSVPQRAAVAGAITVALAK
jgi:pseudouridine-5'-phosphate glycosidase